jgi:hypothetical protein
MDQSISDLVAVIGIVAALAVTYGKAFGGYQESISQAVIDACSIRSRYRHISKSRGGGCHRHRVHPSGRAVDRAMGHRARRRPGRTPGTCGGLPNSRDRAATAVRAGRGPEVSSAMTRRTCNPPTSRHHGSAEGARRAERYRWTQIRREQHRRKVTDRRPAGANNEHMMPPTPEPPRRPAHRAAVPLVGVSAGRADFRAVTPSTNRPDASRCRYGGHMSIHPLACGGEPPAVQ